MQQGQVRGGAASGAGGTGTPFEFRVEPSNEAGSRARSGTLHTPHGTLDLPCFLPVATRGALRLLDWADLEHLGFEAVLMNSYHLMLRPGTAVVAAAGGLHSFVGWDRPIVTDSGGFQAMSLGGVASDEGIRFKSVYDGSSCLLTPEDALTVQAELGVDVAVALDECPRLPASSTRVEVATRRSLEWARRSAEAFDLYGRQLLVGVVQGGTDVELRVQVAEEMADLGFGALAIGGLSVGESFEERLAVLDALADVLPADRPRYLMGVGDPLTLVEAVWRGIDLFDSVLPTRLGRHGSALGWTGRLNLRSSVLQGSEEPIDPKCGCPTCSRYSKGYLRHLLLVGEETGRRLVSVHNLHFLKEFMEAVRKAIRLGTLAELRAEVWDSWARRTFKARSARSR